MALFRDRSRPGTGSETTPYSIQESQLSDKVACSTPRPERARAPFHTPPKGRTRRQRRNEKDVMPPAPPPSVLAVLYANTVPKEDLLKLLEYRMAGIPRRDDRYVQKMGMLRTLNYYILTAKTLNPRGLNAFRDLIGSVVRHNMGVKAFTARLAKLCDEETFHGAVIAAAKDDFRSGKVARTLKRNERKGDAFLAGQAVLHSLYPDQQPLDAN